MKNRFGAGVAIVLMISALAYLYVPTIAAQPGDAGDPLVTRRFVEMQIAQLEAEITALRAAVASIDPNAVFTPHHHQGHGQYSGQAPLSQADTDELFARVTSYINARLADGGFHVQTAAAPNAFTTLHMLAGQTLTFEAGAEFILRGGGAIAVTGAYNGIPDVTAGADVLNGEQIGHNHLMFIPRTDGRGVIFTAESWIMVRGGYVIH